MKKLREKCKNKKGFTMVELIVVIVIILVLAAVLVPSLLKYINRANEANVKSDAATALVQLQADAADWYSDSTKTGAFAPTEVAGVTVQAIGSTGYTSTPDNGKCAFIISSDKDIESFSYGNAKYTIEWTKADGWKAAVLRSNAS